MMTLGELLEQQRLDDAIASMLEVRVPLIVGDLNFQAGTWKGLPIHPKEAGQFEDIANTLSADEKVIIKWSALFLNLGRNYEIRRLLGNFSPAITVSGVSGGTETVVDESNDSN